MLMMREFNSSSFFFVCFISTHTLNPIAFQKFLLCAPAIVDKIVSQLLCFFVVSLIPLGDFNFLLLCFCCRTSSSLAFVQHSTTNYFLQFYFLKGVFILYFCFIFSEKIIFSS